MAVDVQEEGHYELFETTKQHRILMLREALWYAWVEGQRGEILVKSDADHEKSRTLQQGRFFVVDFEDDPNYRDVPHLFLERDERYQELVLPNGLPTDRDDRKKIIATDNTLGRDELETYLQHPASAGEDEAAGLPLANYATLTVEEIADRLDALDEEEVETLRRYETAHKNRKTLRRTLDRRLQKVK